MIAVYNIPLRKEYKYKDYLFFINGVLNLTQKELVILSDFIIVMFEKNEKDNIFSTEIRKEVAKKNQIKNINTYVKKYIDSNLVIKRGENYLPNPILIPQETGVTFNFKWT